MVAKYLGANSIIRAFTTLLRRAATIAVLVRLGFTGPLLKDELVENEVVEDEPEFETAAIWTNCWAGYHNMGTIFKAQLHILALATILRSR